MVAIKSEETPSFSKDDSLTNWSNEDESRLFITSIVQNAINGKVKKKFRNNNFEKQRPLIPLSSAARLLQNKESSSPRSLRPLV